MVAEPGRSKWAERFTIAAIIQGIVVLVMILVLLYLALFGTPEASRVVASGSAGTWLTVGFIGFLTVGVLGTAVSALFYNYLEAVRRKPFTRTLDGLAWGHLLLMNAGALMASGLMMYAGYVGGGMALPTSSGGGGKTGLEVHEFMVDFVEPIAYAMAVGALGVFFGGVAYVWALKQPSLAPEPELTTPNSREPAK